MDDDGDDKDDTKRRTRNLSEKKRRDQFNMLVTELSTLITCNNRKMDKSTVLKSTISFLKNHNEVTVRSRAHDVQEDWKPAFLSNEEFTYLVLEALEGFVMVFSASGRIYYVSESITSLLGYNSVDIVNKSIFDLTFEEDRHNLYNLLQSNANATEQMPNSSKENEMIRFQIHLRRGTLDFKEDVSYDLVQFYGHCRTSQEQADDDRDMMGYQDHDSRILFVCIGRLHTPQLICDVSLVDSSRNEFTSRHSLEWKFLFLDHRAPPIIGYLPFEVLGTSGYDYYHFDDLEKVVSCHEALMQKGELTSCYYRFLTKGQQWIWLQSRFYITYHQWNSKPEFVVCTHRVVSYADVAKTMKEEDSDVPETEVKLSNIMKDTATDEPMPPVSPSYMSEAASDAFTNPYQPISQKGLMDLSVTVPEITLSKVPSPKLSPAITLSSNVSPLTISSVTVAPLAISPTNILQPHVSMPAISPSYTAVTANDGHGNCFQLVSKNTIAAPISPERVDLSPSCMSERNFIQFSQKNIKSPLSELTMPEYSEATSDVFGVSQHSGSEPASVKSASAGSTTGTVGTATVTGASWSRPHTRYNGGSDTASHSGESRSSHRNSERESQKPTESPLAPQHAIGAQYLNTSEYSLGDGVQIPPGMLAVSTLPVIVTSDQAQMQEQLQRKHEELQQMIMRQQEELRQVKEQLLLARLGILQPLINVPNPYSTSEEIQNQQRMAAQLAYSNAVPRAAITGYPHMPVPLQSLPSLPAPHPPHPLHPPQPPQPTHPPQPPHPTHPSEPHQHMPQ